MTTPAPDMRALRRRLKEMVIEVCDLDGLTPDDIDDDERLIRGGGRFDLGSLDALEIAAAVDKEYGVRVEDISLAKTAFRSIATLSEHISRARGWA